MNKTNIIHNNIILTIRNYNLFKNHEYSQQIITIFSCLLWKGNIFLFKKFTKRNSNRFIKMEAFLILCRREIYFFQTNSFEILSIRDFEYSGFWVFGILSIRDFKHSGFWAFGILSLSGFWVFGILFFRSFVTIPLSFSKISQKQFLFKNYDFPFPRYHRSNFSEIFWKRKIILHE
jgi:hypothetical protein